MFLKAKQYLNQAYRLNELIESNNLEIAQLNQLKASLSGIDYSKDKIQNSSSGDANFTKIVERIDELERIIKEDTAKMLSLKIEIRNVINSVKDNEERLVLKCRYLNFMIWDDICEAAHVSLRTVFRIHDSALENVKIPE